MYFYSQSPGDSYATARAEINLKIEDFSFDPP